MDNNTQNQQQQPTQALTRRQAIVQQFNWFDSVPAFDNQTLSALVIDTKKDADGNTIPNTLVIHPTKRKEVAEALSLSTKKDKDLLDEIMQKAAEDGVAMAEHYLIELKKNKNVALRGLTATPVKNDPDGVNVVIRLRGSGAAKTVSEMAAIKAIAARYSKALGRNVSIEEVLEIIKRQEEALKSQQQTEADKTVDVDSNKSEDTENETEGETEPEEMTEEQLEAATRPS